MRTRRERLLRQREELLSIIDGLDVSIAVVDPRTYEVLYANRSAKQLAGNDDSAEACFARFRGKTEPCATCSLNHIDEDTPGVFREEIYQEALSKYLLSVSRMIRWSDDRIVKLGACIDISDQKRAEVELTTAKNHLSMLLESISDGFLALDGTLTLTYMNSASERLLGRAKDEVMGKYLFDAFPEAKGSIFEYEYKRALKLRVPIEFETHFQAPPFENWYYVRVYPWMEGISVFFTLTTETRRAAEVAARAERFRSVAELSVGLAHNFNNLLQIILGAAQLALMNLVSGRMDDIQDRLTQIVDSAKMDINTARRLQGFAKLGSGFAEKNRKTLDVHNIIQQALEMSRTWWKTLPERLGKKITVDIKSEPGLYIEGIESDVFEIILNLIKNAAEALPSGGDISIRASHVGQFVAVEVVDTGMGMSPEVLAKAFDPFFTTKGIKGTGMGLAFCAGASAQHGGSITATSKGPGKGSRFTLRLPAVHEVAFGERR